MKPFRFKNFKINQRTSVFRVGTDAVLLGALAGVSKAANVLEVGTGTGVVSLMLAQRNSLADIVAIDIDAEAAFLAGENFQNSPFAKRLKAECCDFKKYQTEKLFDFIVSNPPYFDKNDSDKDIFARQKVALDFDKLIEVSGMFLSERGVFSVIIPSSETTGFIDLAFEKDLYLIRKINIYGIEGGALKRNILEFSFQPKNLTEFDFVVEKSPRQYSDAYLELTSEFHFFEK